jgi:hypothetical protein
LESPTISKLIKTIPSMSNNKSISAKKLKNIGDPSLVHSHKAGAIVELVQPAVDKKWGRYYFNHGRYRNYLMFSIAQYNYKKSISLLNKCREIPVDNAGSRHVDIDLRDRLEKSSSQFVVFVKLGFEYLVAECLPTIKQIKDHRNEQFNAPGNESDLLAKINILTKNLGILDKTPGSVDLILRRRDIVEHPTPDRLYNCIDSEWKNNHLAWILSGEFEGCMDEIVNFVNKISMSMEKYINENPIPGELKLGIRGLKAGEPFNK